LPNERAFGLIGQVFGQVAALEPWIVDSSPLPYVGLLFSRRSADMYSSADASQVLRESNGFYKVCVETHLPVAYLLDQTISLDNLRRFRVVILPDAAALDDAACEALGAYVQAGGGLLATFESSARTAEGALRENFLLADVFGCDLAGPPSNNITWMNAEPSSAATQIGAALDGTFQLFRDSPTYTPVRMHSAAVAVATRFRPPFESVEGERHTSHFEPPYQATGEPLIVANRYGHGCCVYLATRPGSVYLTHGYHHLQTLLAQCLLWAAQTEPPLSTDAPSSVETVLSRQGDRLVLHLLNFTCRPALPASVTSFPYAGPSALQKSYTRYDASIRLAALSVAVRTESTPRRVYRAPEGAPLAFSYAKGCVRFQLDELHESACIVIEI
jgi:hypothetical protein